MLERITEATISSTLSQKTADLLQEPDFLWLTKGPKYRVDGEGNPVIKVAALEVPLDTDIWQGLRNPAMVGRYPMGLPEIWEYYSRITASSVDETGRGTIFSTAKDFDCAQDKFQRAVLISVMLPLAEEPFHDFVTLMETDGRGSVDFYNQWWSLMNKLLDRAVGRLGLSLRGNSRAAVMLTDKTLGTITEKVVPATRRGKEHGPCKGGNFPHKSLAALTGLGQFGVNRLVIRDEDISGKVERFMGPIRSAVVFEETPANGDLKKMGSDWLALAYRVNDFRTVDGTTEKLRFCGYTGDPDSDDLCRECVVACPSGALANSTPMPSGQYSERLAAMGHRISDGFMQFDYNRCIEERTRLTELYDEWGCSRCFAACMVKGKRRADAVDRFHSAR